MRVLGIDPGTICTGIGVVESDGRAYKSIYYGTAKNSSKWLFTRKFQNIYQEIIKVIETYSPDCLAVEDIFYCKNFQSALRLGEARGVIILAGATAEIPVWQYSPRKVKQAVVGYGNAHKTQVQKMVKSLLGLAEIPQPEDAADALAIAICHIQMSTGILQEGKQL
ncbi:MAG: crossover junction endodeoxyribonuclease RuvC [Candidatus Theseobacter exili]|nr:crossover junction endodeoxyribonuclease RuvC [Candidatus Theseobacter exili]